MNKEQRRARYVQMFMDSDCTSVKNYYVKPSSRKVNIEWGIKKQMLARNGKHYRVLGGSNFVFTCAYVYPKDDIWILVVETVSNHLEYDLTDEEVHLLCL